MKKLPIFEIIKYREFIVLKKAIMFEWMTIYKLDLKKEEKKVALPG